jgi:NADH:ubiquinone oxidoreductase subunit 2 (subunit N)
LYYYLQVLKQIYVVEPPPDAGKVLTPVLTQIALVALALGVIVLGCAPGLLIDGLASAVRLAGR